MMTDKGQQAFDTLIGGGGYSSLNPDAKRAFVSFFAVDAEVVAARGLVGKALHDKWEGAKRAALDAVRDHKKLGIFEAGMP